MRITKKFSGASCIGKQVYQPSADLAANRVDFASIEEELKELERTFLKRLFSKFGIMPSSSSLLDELHSTEASHSLGFKAKLKFELNEKSNRPKRVASAPELANLANVGKKVQAYSSLLKRHRTQSLMQLEHYTVDDTAAGIQI